LEVQSGQVTRLLEEARRDAAAERENRAVAQSNLDARTMELASATRELAEVRQKVDELSGETRRLSQAVAEFESESAELRSSVNAGCDREKAQESSIRSLEARAREREVEVNRLQTLLDAETTRRRETGSHAETLESQIADLTTLLAEKVAELQRCSDRESELQLCVRRNKEQLEKSAAVTIDQELEIKRLNNAIEDLRVAESALCARVRELTNQHDTACRRIRELDGRSQEATRTMDARDRELAGLRYAILDATRIGAHINRERVEAECQIVDGWKRLIGALLHTPLSPPQRGLVTEITSALDGWRKGRAASESRFELHIEPPRLRCLEFNCGEIIERSLEDVRRTAAQAGIKVRTSLTGEAPARGFGSAQHVHQLVTTLASAFAAVSGAENVEVQAAFEATHTSEPGLAISMVADSGNPSEDLYLRLTEVVNNSDPLASMFDPQEVALASAWQLGLALGGRPTIDQPAEGRLRLRVLMTLRSALQV
jgi:hypothetical protein